MTRVFMGPAGCSSVKMPGLVGHAIFYHIGSLQQDAMDTLEPRL